MSLSQSLKTSHGFANYNADIISKTLGFYARMKISVNKAISVLGFYGYTSENYFFFPLKSSIQEYKVLPLLFQYETKENCIHRNKDGRDYKKG